MLRRTPDHIIQIGYARDDDWAHWECSCGTGGSLPAYRDVETAAERHVPDDETLTYRHGLAAPS